jgi:3-methyladenine DNA glycosylase AlkC
MGAMNELIDRRTVDALRAQVSRAAAGRRLPALAAAAGGVDGLNLRARSDLVAAALLDDLPGGYAETAAVFRRALADAAFTGWMIWPVTTAAVTAALERGDSDAFDDAMALLAELTPRLTAEFAVRPMLQHDPARALEAVTGWTAHPDEHVRRLASEGTRLYLPWAVRVPALLEAPHSTQQVIDALYRDAGAYVRRSVANHLNDLGRLAPDLAVATAARWLADPDENTSRLVRHGLRTLVKKAHPGAMALMGFHPAEVAVGPLLLDSDTVHAPGALTFAFDVTNTGSAASVLAVDYVVGYLKANGSHAEKTFKLTTRTLRPGETARIRKSHAFRQMTTRVHHPGLHRIEVQINGARHARTDFRLDV